jgi:hypothetical protein
MTEGTKRHDEKRSVQEPDHGDTEAGEARHRLDSSPNEHGHFRHAGVRELGQIGSQQPRREWLDDSVEPEVT